jgi:hypothetical protein
VEALGFVAGVVDLDWALACFVKLCCLALGRWFVGPVEGRLFAELAKARGGLLWRSDSIGSMTEAVFGYCLGDFVGKEMGRMSNIVGEVAPTAWCDLLLWMSSGGGWMRSCSIFLLDSRNMGQYFVRWLVSLSWYMQYGGLKGLRL